jgi:hypothetical protein
LIFFAEGFAVEGVAFTSSRGYLCSVVKVMAVCICLGHQAGLLYKMLENKEEQENILVLCC